MSKLANNSLKTKKLPFVRERQFCPGPTPVPLHSRLLMVDQVPYHRQEGFYSTFRHCREMLSPLFGSASAPLILTSSGTGAMEAALVNCTEVGDKVLCLVGGKFGERWLDLATAFGCEVHTLSFPWGQVPAVEELEEVLAKHPGFKAVFMQQCETSTGVCLPVGAYGQAINRHSDALVVVDAISSLGAEPMKMNQWGIDIVVSGSQKGLSTPPGLSFIACSERMQRRWSKRPRFYFDLPKEFKNQEKGQSSFTPASSLIVGLEASLAAITAYGVEDYVAFHQGLAQGVRRALEAMGLKLLGEGHFSNGLSAAFIPQEVDGNLLLKRLQERVGMIFAGGQDQLAGKIVRFAHLGMIDYFDICAGIIGLEQELFYLGCGNVLGAGISAFLQEG